MLIRLLKSTFRRRKKRIAIALLAVALGASLISALINVSLEITEKVGRELRRYGANILVEPKTKKVPVQIGGINYGEVGETAYIEEKNLSKIKTIFWKNNILAFAPYLDGIVKVDGRKEAVLTGTWFEKKMTLPKEKVFKTGAKDVTSWWQVKGRWIKTAQESSASTVGVSLAKALGLKLGDSFTVRYQGEEQRFKVMGIVTTGGFEDNQIFVNLKVAQNLFHQPGRVGRVLVSTLIVPEKKKKDPEKMTPKEYEKWYCTPYVRSIARQIGEVLPGARAKPIKQIAEAEGQLLSKMELLMALIIIVALATSMLGVGTTMSSLVIERRREIALMKAIGAENNQISIQLLAEATLIGFLGGILGYLGGIGLAWLIGVQVFNTPVLPNLLIFPLVLGISLSVALLGSLLPARRAGSFAPATILQSG